MNLDVILNVLPSVTYLKRINSLLQDLMYVSFLLFFLSLCDMLT